MSLRWCHLPQPWLWPSVTPPLPAGLPGLPGSSLELLNKWQNHLFSFCLLLAQLHVLVWPKADRHLKKNDANRGGDEKLCHIYPPDSQLLQADVSGYSSLSLGRGYREENLVCGEVQLGWEKREWGKKAWKRDQGVMGKEGKVRRKLEIARNRGNQKIKRLKSRLKCLRKGVGREGRERKGSTEG